MTNEQHEPALLVEVKPRAAALPDAYAQLKQYAELIALPLFSLAVTPEAFVLWGAFGESESRGTDSKFIGLKSPSPSLLDFALRTRPLCVVNPEVCLKEFVTLSRFPLSGMRENDFLMVVRSWLLFQLFATREQLQNDDANRWLVDSGLHQQIYRGYIHVEALV